MQSRSRTALYHLTRAANLEIILRDGLRPMVGDRSLQIGEVRPMIYLFATLADLDNALSNWLGEAFDEEPLALIEVILPPTIPTRRVAFEIQVESPIPAGALRVISRDYGD